MGFDGFGGPTGFGFPRETSARSVCFWGTFIDDDGSIGGYSLPFFALRAKGVMITMICLVPVSTVNGPQLQRPHSPAIFPWQLFNHLVAVPSRRSREQKLWRNFSVFLRFGPLCSSVDREE